MNTKFKVIELDWYCNFSVIVQSRFKSKKRQLQEIQEIYDWELEDYNNNIDDYDGPFRYIEKCEDPEFPKREGLKYCVRISPEEDKKNRIARTTPKEYRGYHCYCYQMGYWWKYKNIEWEFTDTYVPRMSLYDYLNLKCPFKFLSKEYKIDVIYYRRWFELRAIGRNSALWRNKILKKK